MNNRYLFRGRRVDNGEWIVGHYTAVPRPMIIAEEGDALCGWEWYDIDPATIGQCTGLNDMQGKKIYEGDLIEWDGQSMDVYEIIYGDDASFFGVPIDGEGKRISGESLGLNNSDHALVVIGTIHDKEAQP